MIRDRSSARGPAICRDELQGADDHSHAPALTTPRPWYCPLAGCLSSDGKGVCRRQTLDKGVAYTTTRLLSGIPLGLGEYALVTLSELAYAGETVAGSKEAGPVRTTEQHRGVPLGYKYKLTQGLRSRVENEASHSMGQVERLVAWFAILRRPTSAADPSEKRPSRD